MAVVALKSTVVTNADATIQTFNPVTQHGGRRRSIVATVEVTNGDSIGSTYRLARLPSNARVAGIFMTCDAITSAAADFGLYQTAANGGAVVDADAYAAAQTIATAITMLPVNLAFKTRDIANCTKLVWEDLALSADSQRTYDLAATLTAAATASGTLSVEVVFVVD